MAQKYFINSDLINRTKVKSKVVLEMLDKLEAKNIRFFEPSSPNAENSSEHAVSADRYLIKRDISQVWKVYTRTHPAHGWTLKSSRFILMNDPHEYTYTYSGDEISREGFRYRIGQTFFLELKLYWHLFNIRYGPFQKSVAARVGIIPVALMVTDIEDECDHYKKFEVSYIKGNESTGKQIIEFHQHPNGTEIIHTSYFNKSPRNLKHYERFHKQLVDKFHGHFKQMIETE